MEAVAVPRVRTIVSCSRCSSRPGGCLSDLRSKRGAGNDEERVRAAGLTRLSPVVDDGWVGMFVWLSGWELGSRGGWAGWWAGLGCEMGWNSAIAEAKASSWLRVVRRRLRRSGVGPQSQQQQQSTHRCMDRARQPAALAGGWLIKCMLHAERSADRTGGHRIQVRSASSKRPPSFPPAFTPAAPTHSRSRSRSIEGRPALDVSIDRNREGWMKDTPKVCSTNSPHERQLVYPIEIDDRDQMASDPQRAKQAAQPDGPPVFRFNPAVVASKCIGLWVMHKAMPGDLVHRLKCLCRLSRRLDWPVWWDDPARPPCPHS